MASSLNIALSSTFTKESRLFISHPRIAAVRAEKLVAFQKNCKPVNPVFRCRNGRFFCAVAASTFDENTALYAKEMERISAKEALILAIKDAGGVNALTTGEGNVASKIEVSERILALERLNPTPRPTTSPLLEGTWEFQWAGATSPGLAAAKVLLKRFSQLATLESLTLDILQGGTIATAKLKILGSIETTFTLTTKTSAGGPIRLREEYLEGTLSTPVIPSENVPDFLKGAVSQLSSAVSNLPDSIRDAINSGLKLSLSGSYERQILVSYLDDEILVARDQSGVPDVLLRVADSVLTFPDELSVSD